MNIPEKAPRADELRWNAEEPSSDALKYALEYNKKYLHWDELKYREFGSSNRYDVWSLMKLTRSMMSNGFSSAGVDFSYVINDDLQRMLYEIDVRVSSGLFPDDDRNEKDRVSEALNSIMDESITSSQMEGASTTAVLAKKMLRSDANPVDRSQRMIVNNYRAMQFIKEHTDVPLTPELIKEIHSIMSCGTLDRTFDEGRFRTDDFIAVRDRFEDVTYYEPIDHSKIDAMISDLCDLINDTERYVHPIVKGIILHFMIAYIHPFVDGNGRVARCLFYWYAIKNGYSLMQYLSISKVIKNHRQKYDLAYLLAETDGNDITYFIKYNLEMIIESISIFTRYVERTIAERKDFDRLLAEYDLSIRQRSILRDMEKNREAVSVYELSRLYQTSYASVRRDILRLEELGFVRTSGKEGHKQMYIFDENGRRNFS